MTQIQTDQAHPSVDALLLKEIEQGENEVVEVPDYEVVVRSESNAIAKKRKQNNRNIIAKKKAALKKLDAYVMKYIDAFRPFLTAKVRKKLGDVISPTEEVALVEAETQLHVHNTDTQHPAFFGYEDIDTTTDSFDSSLLHPACLLPFMIDDDEPEDLAQYEETKLPPIESDFKTILKKQPSCVKNGEMHDYQIYGLNWFISRYDNGISGVLGDQMGLGKTLQTISFLAYMKYVRKCNGPYLVVVPLSVMGNWKKEFSRWAPGLKVVRYHGPPSERRRLMNSTCRYGEFDVIITTYETVSLEVDFFRFLFHWEIVILDEGHRMKNEVSLQHRNISSLTYVNMFILTGTLIQNNMHELWAVLHFLYPSIFPSSSSFKFDKSFDLHTNSVDHVLLAKAHVLLKPIMLRRLKVDILQKLPPKIETKVMITMTQHQKEWYRRIIANDLTSVSLNDDGNDISNDIAIDANGSNSSGQSEWKRLLSLFMQLRKVCNHTSLITSELEIVSDSDDDKTTDKEHLYKLIHGSGKMRMLDKLLIKLKNEGHRVLLFSLFTKMLDILEDYCILKGWKYARLDGSTNRVRRTIDIQRFNKPGSELFIYLISARAGGLGINLTSADTVIHYDSDFNPQVDLQAQDRAHRIGQKKTVNVYRLVIRDSVEERLIQRADKKLFLELMLSQRMHNKAMKEQAQQLQQEGLTKGEMLSMLMFGAERIFESGHDHDDDENEVNSDDELDILLASSDTKSSESKDQFKGMEKLVEHRQYSVKDFNMKVKELGIREFQGKVLEKKKTNSKSLFDVDVTKIVEGKRSRKSRYFDNKNTALTKEDITSLEVQSSMKRKRGRPKKEIPESSSDDEFLASSNDDDDNNDIKIKKVIGSTYQMRRTMPKYHELKKRGSNMKKLKNILFRKNKKIIHKLRLETNSPDSNLPRYITKEEEYEYIPKYVYKIDVIRHKRIKGSRCVPVQNITFYNYSEPLASRDIDGELFLSKIPFEEDIIIKKNKKRRKQQKQQEKLLSKQKLSKSNKNNKNNNNSNTNYVNNAEWIHEDWCHLCKVGGELICCKYCPRAYHVECVGLEDIPRGFYSCPQHSCALCERKASDCGGLLFRCACCPCSYCEDHVPNTWEGREDLDTCSELEKVGFKQPASAYFILCSTSCRTYYWGWKKGEHEEDKIAENILIPTNFSDNTSDDKVHICKCLRPQLKKQQLYCICQTPYDEDKFYICCDDCNQWFHGACVNVGEDEIAENDEYQCSSCTTKLNRISADSKTEAFKLEKSDLVESESSSSEELSEEEDDEEGNDDELEERDDWGYKKAIQKEMAEEIRRPYRKKKTKNKNMKQAEENNLLEMNEKKSESFQKEYPATSNEKNQNNNQNNEKQEMATPPSLQSQLVQVRLELPTTDWTITQVETWLKDKLKLPNLAHILSTNHISGEEIALLTSEDLKAMEVPCEEITSFMRTMTNV